MASFRSGIKIISDVSKREGCELLHQRSYTAEVSATLGLKRCYTEDGRPVSPLQCNAASDGNAAKDDQLKHMTDVVAAETSWFSPFIKRQDKPVLKPLPLQSTVSSQTNSNKFLVPNKGPQKPNRYFSMDATSRIISMEHCKRDPPVPYVGPPPQEKKSCLKKQTRSCFKETFMPKIARKKVEEKSSVACGAKLQKRGSFCEKKSQVKAFSVCPKPIPRTLFKCPEVPKAVIIAAKNRKLDSTVKIPTFKVCPKPPPRKPQPMCGIIMPINRATIKKRLKKPPRTPRRCICPNDFDFIQENKGPPLYKMNPEIPFPVCHKKRTRKREPFQWPLTNLVCSGVPGGSCATKCGESAKQVVKSGSCKSLQGGPCVDDQPCPYRLPPPPPTHKVVSCGSTRPAFPPSTQDELPSRSASMPKSDPKRVPSSSKAPKKVQSLTSTTKKGSSSKSARSSSAEARSAMPSGSLLKASTASTAGSGSRKASSKPSNKKSSNKKDCSQMPWKNKNKSSNKKCEPQFKWPGCRVPKYTVCGRTVRPKRRCKKRQPPTPSFSECYRRVCKVKKCSPCPCVRVLPISECDSKEKIRHLQPRERIFKLRRRFVFPPPTVELFVDPTIAECCRLAKTPVQAPIAPLTCVKPPSSTTTAVAKPAEKKKKEKDCALTVFLRSLVSFMKGESECPKPPKEVKKAALQMKDPCPMQDVCKPKKPKDKKLSAPKEPCGSKEPPSSPSGSGGSKLKKKKKKTPRCSDLRMPGCSERKRADCTIVIPHKECKKRLAARPSFSECAKNNFPKIKCTECRIALKRAKTLSDLRAKGVRVTPANLRMQCALCLRPTSKSCEIAIKKLDCIKVPHTTKTTPCVQVGLESDGKFKHEPPPAPIKECKWPSSKKKPCEEPPKKDASKQPKGEGKKKIPRNELPANNPKCDKKGKDCDKP